MTALVWARCAEIVTTDSRTPTIATKIPTRRVLGSAACSGVTSISVMKQTPFPPRNSENTATNHLGDFTEFADLRDECADLDLRADQLDDETRGVGRQHLAGDPTQQRRH